MPRIPGHTVEDAPEASRPLLAQMVQFSPTGRLLAMHAQMAHAPAVLDAYVSIRRATAGLNYAGTEPDLPSPAAPGPAPAAAPGR